jgi:hypothetical protein
MVSHCANPACSAVFRYLYEGQLFHLPVRSAVAQEVDPHATPALESFWLCTECSRKMTLIPGPAGASLVPLQRWSKPNHPAPAEKDRFRHHLHSR